MFAPGGCAESTKWSITLRNLSTNFLCILGDIATLSFYCLITTTHIHTNYYGYCPLMKFVRCFLHISDGAFCVWALSNEFGTAISSCYGPFKLLFATESKVQLLTVNRLLSSHTCKLLQLWSGLNQHRLVLILLFFQWSLQEHKWNNKNQTNKI